VGSWIHGNETSDSIKGWLAERLLVSDKESSTDLVCQVGCHLKCVPYHHGMARSQVADGGEGVQIWRVTANTLNLKSRIADKGWGGPRLGHERDIKHDLNIGKKTDLELVML